MKISSLSIIVIIVMLAVSMSQPSFAITNLASPLKQFKSGISVQDVQCRQDLILMIKTEEHSPACVKPQTAQNLVQRGWGDISSSITKQTSEITPRLSSFMPCQIPYSKIGTGIAVLYLPTNITGKICVQYSNPNSPQPVGIKIFNAQDMSKNASNIIVSSNLSVIPTGNSTAVYDITTDNHTAFYGISLFCGGIPFAVGHDDNSTIVKDDFPWLGQTFNCPNQSYTFHIVGLTGIGIIQIQ